MVKFKKIGLNNKNGRVVVVAAAAAAGILLVASIATIGGAPFSYQQPASDRQGPRITSANIVDGEVRNQDLADDAVTTDKIRDGEVKAEDLDPSIDIGGGGETPSFSLQVTERSNTMLIPEDRAPLTINVQCNSDEIVTGGGFATDNPENDVLASQKQDNGWSVRWDLHLGGGTSITVHAECLKIVEEGTTG